jgi:hypothetical protein
MIIFFDESLLKNSKSWFIKSIGPFLSQKFSDLDENLSPVDYPNPGKSGEIIK